MTSPGIYHLFVYGSLRSGFRSLSYEYVSHFFHLISDAKVKGKLYDLDSYYGAIPTQDDNFIIGELYEINEQNEFSWAIGQLDDYEGVNVESDEMQLYRRAITEVYFDNKVVNAWIYWYSGDVNGKPVIASGDLLKYIQEKK